jgi:hypothetical protein
VEVGREGLFSCYFILQYALKHLLRLLNKILRKRSFLQPLAVGIQTATYGESKSLLYNKNDKLMRSKGV